MGKTLSYFNMTALVQVHLELCCSVQSPHLNSLKHLWGELQHQLCQPDITTQQQCCTSLMMLWLNESKSLQTGSKIWWKGVPREWRLIQWKINADGFEMRCLKVMHGCDIELSTYLYPHHVPYSVQNCQTLPIKWSQGEAKWWKASGKLMQDLHKMINLIVINFS